MQEEIVAFNITDGTRGTIKARGRVCFQVEGAPDSWLGSFFGRADRVNPVDGTGKLNLTVKATNLPDDVSEVEATYDPSTAKGKGHAKILKS